MSAGAGTDVAFDEHGRARLDGRWAVYPGDHGPADLDAVPAQPVEVPGLGEAQGHREPHGVAWYRRSLALGDVEGFWTLRFGAVAGPADVYVNGRLLGTHDRPFTPFELDPTAVLVRGANDLAVRVVDPGVDDQHRRPDHDGPSRAGGALPGRPGLSGAWGGIRRSVTLRRHGPVVVADAFVGADPDDLVVAVEVGNRSGTVRSARLTVHALGTTAVLDADVAPGEVRRVEAHLGATPAARWRPEAPVLHHCLVEAGVDGARSDGRSVRFGLRRVRVEGNRVTVDGEPYRMRSALVRAFGAEGRSAGAVRAGIEDEVRAALALGFNTLRLHGPALDPAYLDVCDEVGMLVHGDVGMAGPIAHGETGPDGRLARRWAVAAAEQVRRDRNHPSVVLWSAMDERCSDRPGAGDRPVDADLARRVLAAVTGADPTRPVIADHRVEAGPEPVGAPGMPSARLAAGVQRHRAMSARLRTEVLRRQDHIGGYCVAGPTGLLDVHRRAGSMAAEIARANQVVLPMLQPGGLVVVAGDLVRAPLHVANDGPPLRDVVVEARFGAAASGPTIEEQASVDATGLAPEPGTARSDESVSAVKVDELPGWRPTTAGRAALVAPEVPGAHDLVLTLWCRGRVVATNRYPVHVVVRPHAPFPVRVLGGGDVAGAVGAVGAGVGPRGPTFVAEAGLDDGVAAEVRARLAAGDTVVMLAQGPEAAVHFPVPVALEPVETSWGSTAFHVTTGSGALPSLPRRAVLVGEDATIAASTVVAGIDGQAVPDLPVVLAHGPVPGAPIATVVGAHPVGPGRLVLCQYRLTRPALAGDPAALALLRDLVCWAVDPRPDMVAERVVKEDGRSLTYYSFPPGWDG